ncbi:MAG: class I SAM-dependent methyltransferase [Deltaproteobacteria bacterium]|nr:class I SAM-dependent methyltransferase [Deltaproteobacteria bacterium]MBI2368494.1 class I SAM-dependent methyltransferase [Deltaproteobacteria bacterium]MBI2532373.1 class I SAM-dependent methyltransferase [Deltaproteobacteria bacterium]
MGQNIAIKTIIRAAFIVGLFIVPTPSRAAQSTHRVDDAHHGFSDVGRWSQILEGAERDQWQQPDEVMKHLNLKPGDVIADIGAGTGYFTRRFALAVGPQGRALGLEIEASMVEHMKQEARKLNLTNYEARLVKPDGPGLEPRSVDVVFLSDAYHHISNRVDYFRKLSRSLKPNGRIVIVDFYKRPLPVGPEAVEDKVSEETVIEELRQAGYRLRKSLNFLPYQYFLEFGL